VGMCDPDEIPVPPGAATTQRGDIWLLGDQHRLMCGDSAIGSDVDHLLNGAAIHLVNSDPPYNVKTEPAAAGSDTMGQEPPSWRSFKNQVRVGVRPAPKAKSTITKQQMIKARRLAHDSLTDEEFDRVLAAWFGNMSRVLLPGHGFYIWGGYANTKNYRIALEHAGLYFSQAIIWHKQHPVISRKDFMGDHEWAFYGWKEGAAHRFFGPNNVPDVWPVKKVNPGQMIHLTEKPVELAARAIQYSSKPGENVLDLFGGSGSTLIACEQQGRRAFLMEIDPLYCDVIVERWEKFSGREAKRIAVDRTAMQQKTPAEAGEIVEGDSE